MILQKVRQSLQRKLDSIRCGPLSFYKYDKPRKFLTSGVLGTMGYGLGASLGAKVGNPDKIVVNIAGDGCFRMNLNELATASRYNIPVIEVIINNSC